MISRDAHHIYRNEKGEIYISMTQHLQIAGYVDFSMVTPQVLEAAGERGQNVHSAVKLYLDDDLSPIDNEPYAGYVRGFERFCKETGFEAWLSEGMVWSDNLRTAGTFDIVGTMASTGMNNFPFMIEIKTPSVLPLTAALQVSGYCHLWNSQCLPKVLRGYVLHLKNNGTYKMTQTSGELIPWFERMARNNWNALNTGIIPVGAKADPKVHRLCQEIIGK